MKKSLIFSLLVFLYLSGYSQVTSKQNLMRVGDEIIKQQVEYKDPGRAGENVIWNFSQLKQVNPKYKVKYKSPRLIDDSIYVMGEDTIQANNADVENLIVGIEHYTHYYYQLKNDSLFCLGYENPTTKIHYDNKLATLIFPLEYKQRFHTNFTSHGFYSSQESLKNRGNIQVEADAYGMIVLPSGDTLKNVLRTKSVQHIQEADSIKLLEKDYLNQEVENYKWYAKGYRYPVFETIRSYEIQDSIRNEAFNIAFFYPPQEHYYLTDDYDNLAVLDSLSNQQGGQPTNPGDGSMHQGGNFAYNYYPNPVQGYLYIEYLLNNDSQVSISVYDMQGKEVRSIPIKSSTKGFWNEVIDCSSLSQGSYVLRINVNNESVNEKIIKK